MNRASVGRQKRVTTRNYPSKLLVECAVSEASTLPDDRDRTGPSSVLFRLTKLWLA